MTTRRERMWAGVVLTAAAWGCFQLMETVPMFSAEQNALHFFGYFCIAIALFLFFKAYRQPSK